MKIPTLLFPLLLTFSSALFAQTTSTTPAANPFANSPPPLGWSSWSSTWNDREKKFNETYIKAQADAMAEKLKPSGFQYINLDDGWAKGFDDHGRLLPDLQKFPSGINGLADYIHSKGLKLGIYLTPGLRIGAYDTNPTVAGTDIHLQTIADKSIQGNTQGKGATRSYHIDFSKLGANEYIQSYADLLASWGVDYIKMDFVGPGGGNVKADTREEMKVWHNALLKTSRPIWLELSNSMSIKEIDTWKSASNGWRIENDVENYNRTGPTQLTRWSKIAVRFDDAPKWASFAAPGNWNDLDSLEIGNGDDDGITPDERRTTLTLWAISCSPLILGSDLAKLDPYDLTLLTNPEVLAINQAGHVATPLSQKEKQQIWQVKNPDNSFTVALFNLADTDSKITLHLSDLNITESTSARDLWQQKDLPKLEKEYTTTLLPHACQLLRLIP